MKDPSKKLLRKAERQIRRNELIRACGTCTACCKALGVEELSKPPGSSCVHEIPAKGCGIYATRPNACVIWSCWWKMGQFEGFDRPDRIGVIIDATEYRKEFPGMFAYVAREAFPGGFEKGEAFLRRLSGERIVILAFTDGKRKLIGPPDWVAYVEQEMQLVEDPSQRKRLPLFQKHGEADDNDSTP